ncbi:MAG: branched-chain amino acid transport system II carrier protein [Neisseria sp.]|uniref:branched-chain amino acid transport system II carrier protein n=1 Tax=Neisseria sp. TaxID=192066 RepID=UPI0026DB263F|nr:branched-chain amino acid transport system II carrier protein [Neisseria sp.]MDO4249555.1 branched-chain amino acid transport system II carrier protein [Neisseria sp.]
MRKGITRVQFFMLSFFLFSMFLGAGNIIFAPPLGQAAGTHTWIAMSGFLITGVGLVLAAIYALSIAGEKIDLLAGRVDKRFAVFYSVLLFLCLGPLFVIPRTAAVVFEVSVNPLLPDSLKQSFWSLLLFSLFFIGSTIYLSLEPSKFVARIGRIITPTFIILLGIIVIKSLATPIGAFGEPTGDYVEHAFGRGFTQGYNTMDVLAAFVFGKIFLDAARLAGVQSEKMPSFFIKAGLFTMIALALVQISLAAMGASSVSAIGISKNGGEALPQIVYLLLGQTGVIMLACVVFLTGWTTAIACLASVAEYFSRQFPQFNYRGWVIIFGLISLLITNFGLNTILTMALPGLYFLYPVSITLMILIFLNRFFDGRQAVYVGAVAAAGLMRVLDGLKSVNLLPAAADAFLSAYIPFYSSGMGWIMLAVSGGIIGWCYFKLTGQGSRRFENSPVS